MSTLFRDVYYVPTPFVLMVEPIVEGDENGRTVSCEFVICHGGQAERMNKRRFAKPLTSGGDQAVEHIRPYSLGEVHQCVYRNGRRSGELFLKTSTGYTPLAEYIRPDELHEMQSASPGPEAPPLALHHLSRIQDKVYKGE